MNIEFKTCPDCNKIMQAKVENGKVVEYYCKQCDKTIKVK